MVEAPSRKVSVIVPAYNAAKTITETLDSVLAQTHADWEVIVADDGSKDDTAAVVGRYAARDPRIRLLALPYNHGAPAGPRNKAVAEATGRWVAFLDSDDIWHPRKLELQVGLMEREGAAFCCSAMSDFTSATDIRFAEIPAKLPIARISYMAQRLKGRIPASSVMMATELALRYPFTEDMRYKAVEDYHCWLRVLREQPHCLKIELPLLQYRRIAGQISGSKVQMMWRVFNLHREFEGTGPVPAAFFTLTHMFGAVYFRLIKRGL